MELVKVELEIGKVEKDVIDALCSIVKALKDKSSLAVIMAEHIPALMVIAGEFGNLKEEINSTDKIAVASYLAVCLEKALA